MITKARIQCLDIYKELQEKGFTIDVNEDQHAVRIFIKKDGVFENRYYRKGDPFFEQVDAYDVIIDGFKSSQSMIEQALKDKDLQDTIYKEVYIYETRYDMRPSFVVLKPSLVRSITDQRMGYDPRESLTLFGMQVYRSEDMGRNSFKIG